MILYNTMFGAFEGASERIIGRIENIAAARSRQSLRHKFMSRSDGVIGYRLPPENISPDFL